ncbi:unnamed protein product, partial [Porites evermanni]
MCLADTLSRAYLSLSLTDTQRSETEKEVESIHAVDYIAISEQQLSETKKETAKDPTLQTLKNVILRGWPENSSSNAVKTAKQLMKKSKQAGTDFYLALLDWRNTPTEGVGCSPVQRLCGRRTRTLPPTSTSLLKPTTSPGVREKLLKKKERQTYYYNRGTQELSPLRKGDAVVMLPSPQARKWKKAQVEDQVDVRSYAVRTEDGRVFRRN